MIIGLLKTLLVFVIFFLFGIISITGAFTLLLYSSGVCDQKVKQCKSKEGLKKIRK